MVLSVLGFDTKLFDIIMVKRTLIEDDGILVKYVECRGQKIILKGKAMKPRLNFAS